MDSRARDAERMVCLLAKVPAVGQVKTRLCPPLSPDDACALARAFLIDTWAELGRVDRATRVLGYAGEATALPVDVAPDRLWPQAPGDLGARMEAVLARGLAHAGRVVLVGSDAPALPRVVLSRAFEELERADAVLGPALDGGYYLLGARRSKSGLLSGLPWSSPRTLRATYRRLRRRGYRVALLPTWFDVDDERSLELLRRVLASGALRAPETSATLAQLRARGQARGQARTGSR